MLAFGYINDKTYTEVTSMRKTVKTLLSATSLLAAASILSGIQLTNRIMYIKPKDTETIIERERLAERFDQAWYDGCDKQLLSIESPYGYSISGIFLRPLETNNTAIICHGVTENKINSVKFARMFERLGFNSVIYDHRRHGESGGKTTSYGYYEKMDLHALVKNVRTKIGDDAILGIHGESMGAVTTLLYAGTIDSLANFYISDCAFSNFSELLSLLSKATIPVNPKYTVPFATFFIRMRDGYSIREISPLDAVTHIEEPVLFIHSVPDSFIPAAMSEQLFDAKKDNKMLKLFDVGEHAQSFNESPYEYEQTVAQFLRKYVPHYRYKSTMPH